MKSSGNKLGPKTGCGEAGETPKMEAKSHSKQFLSKALRSKSGTGKKVKK